MNTFALERRTVSPDGKTIDSREILAVFNGVPDTAGKVELARLQHNDIKANFPDSDEVGIGLVPPEEGVVGNATFRVFKENRCLAEYAVIEGEALEVPKGVAELLDRLGLLPKGGFTR